MPKLYTNLDNGQVVEATEYKRDDVVGGLGEKTFIDGFPIGWLRSTGYNHYVNCVNYNGITHPVEEGEFLVRALEQPELVGVIDAEQFHKLFEVKPE